MKTKAQKGKNERKEDWCQDLCRQMLMTIADYNIRLGKHHLKRGYWIKFLSNNPSSTDGFLKQTVSQAQMRQWMCLLFPFLEANLN
jgi:hypothetical protein